MTLTQRVQRLTPHAAITLMHTSYLKYFISHDVTNILISGAVFSSVAYIRLAYIRHSS